jgi:hypothetical protein
LPVAEVSSANAGDVVGSGEAWRGALVWPVVRFVVDFVLMLWGKREGAGRSPAFSSFSSLLLP